MAAQAPMWFLSAKNRAGDMKKDRFPMSWDILANRANMPRLVHSLFTSDGTWNSALEKPTLANSSIIAVMPAVTAVAIEDPDLDSSPSTLDSHADGTSLPNVPYTTGP